MPTIGIQIRPRVLLESLLAQAKRMDRLQEPLRKAVGIIRRRVALEFLNRTWFMPSGGSRKWKALVPFGRARENATGGPLVNTGGYYRALMGRGVGSVVRVTRRSVTVGVDGSVHPGAATMRGGTGSRVRVTDWIIRPRARVSGGRRRRPWVQQWKMWWALLFKYGVALSERTLRRGLRVPPRPHLTKHPVLVRQLRDLFSRWIKSGRLS